MHGVVGEYPGVLEYDRPNRCFPPPLGELLARLSGRPEGGPGWRSSSHRPGPRPSRGGNVQIAPPSSVRPSRSGSAPTSSREQDIASRNGSASNCTHRRERSSSPRQRSICALRSSCRSRAASSSSAATRFLSRSRSAASISRASRSASRCRIPPRRRRRSMSSSITLERLPSSRLMVSVFLTSTSSTRSSSRCGSTK